MLKNNLLLAFLCVLAFSACEKKAVYDGDVQLLIDEERIKKWADSAGLTFTRDDSGLHYQVLSIGSGEQPELSDSLTVEYEGRLLGDSITFSQASDLQPYKFVLKNAIEGWRTGLPLIKQGGRVRLVIPSSLAYKDYVVGGVPKNSVLDFTIDLKKIVKNR